MTDYKKRVALFMSSIALVAMGFSYTAEAGQNFLITPSGSLPTSVTAGSTVTASYTITNQTSTTRSGYTISGLPTTVVQNTVGIGVCQTPLTLAAHSQCTLQLTISGAAQGRFALCNGSSCTSAATPLNVALSGSPSVLAIASGGYSSSSTQYPLIATTPNASGPWVYPIDAGSTLPSGYSNNGLFYDPSCNGENCVTVGFYVSGNTQYPLIASSTNGGGTWTYTIDASSTLPSGYTNSGEFGAVSCSGENCVTVGSYVSGNTQYPLIATSTDGGGTWTYTIDASSTLPSGYTNSGVFNAVSCSGENCVTVGSYVSGNTQYPLIATSTDGGSIWTYTIDASSTLPSGYNNSGEFSAVSCSGENCVTVGSYLSGNNYYPLIATSTDGGSIWTYTIDASSALPSDFVGGGEFNAVSCSGENCVTVGSYLSSNVQDPLIATSTDGGSTWTYTIDASSALPSDFVSGTFFAVTCSGENCVTVGTYDGSGNTEYPLIATSTDGGSIWTYTIDASSALPSDYFGNGVFFAVTCSGDNCVAGGKYSNNSATQYLLIATSTNRGGSWAYSLDSSSPLPLLFQTTNGFTGTTTK